MPISTTTLAVATSICVAAIAGLMAALGFKSFRKTRNPRLLFVVTAFGVFSLKSVFVAYNVNSHVVPHDGIEFVSAIFDLLIVVLLFLPFIVNFDRR